MIFPCTNCGHELDPRKFKRKFVHKTSVLVLTNPEPHDAGFIIECPRCNIKSTFNPDYVKEELKERPRLRARLFH